MGKKKSNGFGKWTRLVTKMALSEAFLSLGQSGTSPIVTGISKDILFNLLFKRKYGKYKKKGQEIWKRSDDNRFTMTYKELTNAPYRYTKTKITRAKDELLAKGFINIVNRGGATKKDKAIVELVDDWKKWRVGDKPIRTRAMDAHRGYQGPPKK